MDSITLEKNRTFIDEQMNKVHEQLESKRNKLALNTALKILEPAKNVYAQSCLKTDRVNLMNCFIILGNCYEALYNKEKDETQLKGANEFYEKALRMLEEEKETNIESKRLILFLYTKLVYLDNQDKNQINNKVYKKIIKDSLKFYHTTKRFDDLHTFINLSTVFGKILKNNAKFSLAIKYYEQAINHMEKIYFEIPSKENEEKLTSLYQAIISCYVPKKKNQVIKSKIKWENKLYHILNYN